MNYLRTKHSKHVCYTEYLWSLSKIKMSWESKAFSVKLRLFKQGRPHAEERQHKPSKSGVWGIVVIFRTMTTPLPPKKFSHWINSISSKTGYWL